MDGGLKVDAVVDGVNPVGGEPPFDEDVRHGVGNANVEIHLPQGHHVCGAVREHGHRPAHVVQAVVAVDGGHHRGLQVLFYQVSHQVAPGAVAVDDVHLLAGQQALKLLQAHHRVAGLDHLDGNAHFLRVVGELAPAKAEELGVDGLVQLLEQVEHMGFGAAGVAAADQMDNAHGVSSRIPAPGGVFSKKLKLPFIIVEVFQGRKASGGIPPKTTRPAR